MQFTLDSIEQFKNSLKAINKGKTITYKPILIKDLNNISQADNKFYFGVLTVGSNIITAVLKDEADSEIITIESNSQIIDYFSSASFLDVDEIELISPKGHFRGFEINIS